MLYYPTKSDLSHSTCSENNAFIREQIQQWFVVDTQGQKSSLRSVVFYEQIINFSSSELHR